jgi:hypothetical protein
MGLRNSSQIGYCGSPRVAQFETSAFVLQCSIIRDEKPARLARSTAPNKNVGVLVTRDFSNMTATLIVFLLGNFLPRFPKFSLKFVALRPAPPAAPLGTSLSHASPRVRLPLSLVWGGRSVMKEYKFKIGQLVIVHTARNDDAPDGAYIITKRLPKHHGHLQYQMRSSSADCHRVVRESELRYHSR